MSPRRRNLGVNTFRWLWSGLPHPLKGGATNLEACVSADLVTFLRAQLDYSANVAQGAVRGREPSWRTDWRGPSEGRVDARLVDTTGEPIFDGYGSVDHAEFCSRQDPQRALAGIEATRLVVDECAKWTAELAQASGLEIHAARQEVAFSVLRALATQYADHPDYLPEWKP